MLAQNILTTESVFDLAGEIAKRTEIARYQNITVTLEELFLARYFDLTSRGIPSTEQCSLILDMYRLFAGYQDFRFTTALASYAYYKASSTDWFTYYNTPFPSNAIWHHITSSEKGVLSGTLADKLILAKQSIDSKPTLYQEILQSKLTK